MDLAGTNYVTFLSSSLVDVILLFSLFIIRTPGAFNILLNFLRIYVYWNISDDALSENPVVGDVTGHIVVLEGLYVDQVIRLFFRLHFDRYFRVSQSLCL